MRTRLLSVLAISFPLAANSTTLTFTSDAPSYEVGEAIVLTLSGDSEGATSWGIAADLHWDPSVATLESVDAPAVGDGWLVFRTYSSGPGHVYTWNQIVPPVGDHIPQLPAVGTATISLRAVGEGQVGLYWGSESDFFGATFPSLNLRVGSVSESAQSIPEPGTGVLLAMGLVAIARRHRAPRGSA